MYYVGGKDMKKLVGLLLCLTMFCSLFVGCAEGEPIVWSELVLGSALPQPTLEKGKINTNSEKSLWMYLNNAEKNDFSSYLAECKETFNIDSKMIGDSYIAYNSDGFKLNIDYNEYDRYISINLDAPMEMKDIKWPLNDLCDLLPTPKSLKGKIEWEHEDKFLLYLSDMDIDEYSTYADSCSDMGFDVDYDKGETYYRAQNAEGYSLSLEYIGYNIMSVKLEVPVQEEESSQPANNEEKPESKETQTNEEKKISNADFKKAMDEYEDFIDEYVAFMKKYRNANGADLSMATDYAKYLNEYADMVSAFEKWEEELSGDDLKYYVEVEARVAKKLVEIAQ